MAGGNVPPPRVQLYNLPCHEFISILGCDFIFVEMFMPFWGRFPLANIFQMGCNHQLEFHDFIHQTSLWNNDPLRLDMSRRVLRSTFASVLTKKATRQWNIARTKRCEFYQFQQWQTHANTTLDGDLDKNFMSLDRYVHIHVYPSINLCMRMYNDVPSTSQEVQDLEIDTELPHSFKANSFYEKNTTHHIRTHDYRYMLISHSKCISVLLLFLKMLAIYIHIIYHPIPST